MNYLVPLNKNMGHTGFMDWLDRQATNGFELAWGFLDLMAWEAQTHPLAKLGETKPTDMEIWEQFHQHDQALIREKFGYESFLDADNNEIYFIVPESDLKDFHWDCIPQPKLFGDKK